MAYTEGFYYAYGWNGFYEKILGLWSLKRENSIFKQWPLFWIVLMSVFTLIPQSASVPIFWGDLDATITCLSINIPYIISMIKIVIIHGRRKDIEYILDTMNKHWTRVEEKREYKEMMKVATLSRSISIASVCLTTAAILGYTSANVSVFLKTMSYVPRISYSQKQIYRTMYTTKDPDLDPRVDNNFLFDTYFPFDTTKPSIFVPIWISQLLGLVSCAASYGAPDCIISMMVLHVCGQLKILCHSLRCIVNEKTLLHPEFYWQKIAAIVERHDQLNQLGSLIKDTVSTLLLLQLLGCSVSFCCQCYVFFTTFMQQTEAGLPIFKLAFYMVYGSDTILHFYLCCYLGDRLSTESSEIADYFYKTAWYNLAPNEARAIIFIVHRSTVPLEIKAGKFSTFNMSLFGRVIKSAMGYLSILMAMKD